MSTDNPPSEIVREHPISDSKSFHLYFHIHLDSVSLLLPERYYLTFYWLRYW